MSAPDQTRRVTAADVARRVGVSRATVGFVLNATPGQTISESTRERVKQAAADLGYRPHKAAQSLRSGRSRLILLVLPEWPMDYSMNRHLEEASQELDLRGYALVTMVPHQDGRSRPLWETLQPDVVMGLVPFAVDLFDEITRSGVGAVSPPRETTQDQFDHALFSQGPSLQVAHLLERGRRHLAYAGPTDPRLADLAASRYRVMREATEAAGLDVWASADLDAENADRVLQAWAHKGVDGIVAYNDNVAAAAIGAAIREGMRIPDDIAVIGHDDSPLARLFIPPISSVRIDNEGFGRFFAETALGLAEGTRSTVQHHPRLQVIARRSS